MMYYHHLTPTLCRIATKISHPIQGINRICTSSRILDNLSTSTNRIKKNYDFKLYQYGGIREKSKKTSAGDHGDKATSLAMAIKQIESNFGKGALMQLGSTDIAQHVEVIPSGSLSLDIALGIGGLPKGRIVEIYGPESSGKTSVALHCIAEAQAKGGICGFIDAEHAIDPQYAKTLGVNIDNLYISQPDSGEQALEICDTLVRSGAMDVVVVDSVAALVPRAELEGEMGDSHIALQARLMSQALRKLTSSLSKSNTLLIFINQIRQKVGILFGNPEVTSGGNALKYYASIRLDIRKKMAIKEGDKIIGNETTIKVVKNKLAPPFRQASFNMIYGVGIDRYSELLDLGANAGLIKRSGSWYSICLENSEEKMMAQGKAKAIDYLKGDLKLTKKLEESIKDHMFGKKVSVLEEMKSTIGNAEEEETHSA